jgi:hypothetical protein
MIRRVANNTKRYLSKHQGYNNETSGDGGSGSLYRFMLRWWTATIVTLLKTSLSASTSRKLRSIGFLSVFDKVA